MDTLNQIKGILKKTLSDNDQAYLFGFRARGTARIDSDWDILILLDKDRIRAADYDSVSYPLTSLGWDIDQNISPVLYTRNEWTAQKSTLFYHNVRKDAIRLI